MLARVGLGEGALSADQHSLILATTLMTMLLSPFVSTLSAPLYAWSRRWRAQPLAPTIPLIEQDLHGHIIIAGYGRVGRYTADLLSRLDMAHVVIERDQNRLDDLNAENVPVIYGDASSPVVL